MYVVTEILFPPQIIPHLTHAGGADWRQLVEHVMTLDETAPESLAFSLMMIRLDGCLECETDSFRAMRGCAACALQTLRRGKRSDQELLRLYQTALRDVQTYLAQPQTTQQMAWALQPA